MEREEEIRASGKGKAHALVIPYPVLGHVNPMLQFSKRLASKGIKVTFITTPSINMYAATAAAQYSGGSIKMEPISDGSEDGTEKTETVDAMLERVRTRVSESLKQLILEKQNDIDDQPPKILVYDSIMPWALDIAQSNGLYGAAFFTQSCAVSAIYHQVHQGALKIPIKDDITSMPWILPRLGASDVPSYIADMDSYPTVLGFVLSRFSNFEKADWLLFNTVNQLEEKVIQWMAGQWPVKTIGPCIPSMYVDKRMEDDKDYGLYLFKPNVEECIKWLDTKGNGSVVYVSFGSLATLGEVQTEEVAWGLKRSQCNFLWVVRESEHNKLPSNFVEETLEKGLVVTWCPQLDVLAHKATGCFVTHCGWNSTLEALSLGVPMVAMPQWTDQPTNAKFVVDVWQVGVRVKVDDVGIVRREEIELCIREVIEGEKGKQFKRNAARWKELAKEAVDEGGSSDRNIDEFVAKLVCS